MSFYLKNKVKKAIKIYNLKYKNYTIDELKKSYSKILSFSQKNKDLELIALAMRAFNISHNINVFDTQIMASFALKENTIIDMKTGEGKTFVSILSAFLRFSLTKDKVYILTANDYLAKRDSLIAIKFFEIFNIKSGFISSTKSHEEKKKVYDGNIIYSNAQELIFDYLRDNLVYNIKDRLLSSLDHLIIDEADFVLLDDARTPFVITGDNNTSNKDYYLFNSLSKKFENKIDYEICMNSKSITFTSKGFEKMENLLIEKDLIKNRRELYTSIGVTYSDMLKNAIKANTIILENREYIIKNNTIVLIDEKTGRLSEGSQFKNGLHQAIEAKEKLDIKKEQRIRSSISVQNFIKRFKSISGMTGTALIEKKELYKLYGVKVVEIPTHKPCIRKDHNDMIFFSLELKNEAIVRKVKELNKKGQPVLVCTSTLDYSEDLSTIFNENSIKHVVLNAKNHMKESEIIASSGKMGAVTIVTNMAGRGTDIILGAGIEEERQKVVKAGGLFILGAERNESRRLDQQLVGRAGRQGDVGESQFYVSLDDRILRDFSDNTKLKTFWQRLGLDKEPTDNSFLSKSVLKVQKIIDGINSDIRKNITMFDDINEEQRLIFFKFRNEILNTDNIFNFVSKFSYPYFIGMIHSHINKNMNKEDFGLNDLFRDIYDKYGLKLEFQKDFSEKEVLSYVKSEYFNHLKTKIYEIDSESIRKKSLVEIDNIWSSYISGLNDLRNNVRLRGFAQEKPIDEYKKEMFNELNKSLLKQRESIFLKFINYEDTYFDIKSMNYEDLFNTAIEETNSATGIGFIYHAGF